MPRGGLYYPLEIFQGEDFEVSFAVLNPDTTEPIDVRNGYTFTGQVGKEYFSADEPLYEWSVPNQNVELANGSVKIRVPAEDSRSWSFRRVFYDVEVCNDTTGEEILVAHGPLVMQPTFARSAS